MKSTFFVAIIALIYRKIKEFANTGRPVKKKDQVVEAHHAVSFGCFWVNLSQFNRWEITHPDQRA